VVNPLSSTLTARLFGGATTSTSGVDPDLLVTAARARAGIGIDVESASADPNAPLAPVWTPGLSPSSAALVQRAMSNKALFDVGAKLYSDLGATGDYRRLFALYSGLSTLQALAGHADAEDLTTSERAQTTAQFARGLGELEAFFSAQKFEDMRLVQGDRVDAAQTGLALPIASEDYATGVIHRGGLFDRVAGLDPDAHFTITATSAAGTVRAVDVDLADMGSIPRTLGNVVSHINARLSAAGAASRVEANDLTPKETSIVLGGRTVKRRYTGPKQYGLKIDVRGSEAISLQAQASAPAFYVVGAAGNGARLIKLTDVGDQPGQPAFLTRPGFTAAPIGAHGATGWYGPGAPYASAPSPAWERRSAQLTSDGASAAESALRSAGEAVLRLATPDGRVFTVSTGWRGGDQEAWRVRPGEDGDRALLDDLAERLTQLMHEQGLAGGVDVWEDGASRGLSFLSAEGLLATSLSIGGKAVALTTAAPTSGEGGLMDGVFARRFEAGAVAGASDLFIGEQSFSITTDSGAQLISIDGGDDGMDATELAQALNAALLERGVRASVALVDDGGALTLRLDALHEVTAFEATLNDVEHEAVLQAPAGWASGGLPSASLSETFGAARRAYTVAGAPLLTHADALDIEIDIATPRGVRTISVAVSALERANDPDPSPGEWSATFQARLDNALNAAGVYASADGANLTQWTVAEDSGQRLQAIRINGDTLSVTSTTPAFALGGAFGAVRSFTTSQLSTSESDDVSTLLSDQTVSISFDTVWGERSVSAVLQGGDAPSLESAALRLNEALAAAGYDLGVVAAPLAGGGAGLRVVSGGSHSIRTVTALEVGGVGVDTTLDPIDSASAVDDPVGALRVAERAARGATVTQTIPSESTFTPPSINAGAWFPGRAFDVSIGGGLKVATVRMVAAGDDGAVYVLANLNGDSTSHPIKGARDVALLKYDAAGKLVFSETLGAAQSAEGFAIAVSSDGKVAVAGAVEGELSGGERATGGTDGFVAVFNANGEELWTARRGAAADDRVNAVSFGPGGAVIVAGQTASALTGQTALGGKDGFVRGYSAAGAELFTRQFGSGADDAATALMVRDDGAGGMQIVTGGVENNRGILRRFDYGSSTGFSVGATRDIGLFLGGAINALAANGTALYVAGEVGADRLDVGVSARASSAGQEGFVARMDVGLSSTTIDRTTYLGSAQSDAVKSLAVVDGEVYAAGAAGGVFAAQGNGTSTSGFLARLDDQGNLAWARTFASSAGGLTLTSMSAAASGASVLDGLGLPHGAIAARDTAALTARSALRVGDEFRIGIDGRRPTVVRIGAEDTLQSLVTTINRAIGAAGRAEIVRAEGQERLKLTARDGRALRLESGVAGRDALAGLGLKPGVVATKATGRGAMKTFGLGLIGAELRLDSKPAIAAAKAELSAAVSIVRQAYDALLNPNARELSAEEKALEERRKNAGAAPEYLTTQLANYQAALARIGGG